MRHLSRRTQLGSSATRDATPATHATAHRPARCSRTQDLYASAEGDKGRYLKLRPNVKLHAIQAARQSTSACERGE